MNQSFFTFLFIALRNTLIGRRLLFARCEIALIFMRECFYTMCEYPCEHLGHLERCWSRCYALSQISCRRFIYNAAGHYATRTMPLCEPRESSPHGHARTGKNNPKRRSSMPHQSFETPRAVIRATCQRSIAP